MLAEGKFWAVLGAVVAVVLALHERYDERPCKTILVRCCFWALAQLMTHDS